MIRHVSKYKAQRPIGNRFRWPPGPRPPAWYDPTAGQPEGTIRLLTLLLVCACSASATQRARTAGAGKVQLGIEPGLGTYLPATEEPLYPALDVALRVGVTERFDVGVRMGSSHAQLQTKLQLTDADGPIVSIAPQLSTKGFGTIVGEEGSPSGPVRSTTVGLPVLVDLPTTERSAVVLGPAIQYSHLGSPTHLSPHWIHAGGSVGYAASFGGSFTLLPEVGVLQGLCCDPRDQPTPPTDGAYRIVQARLGFLFGQSFE
jgi:hypothetical protein